MSIQQPAALPDPQTAFNNLMSGVHGRVFFGKLASYGIVPQSEKQAAAMLELGGKLRVASQHEQVKQAEDANDPILMANAALDRVMSQHGLDGQFKQAAANDEAHAIRQAAANLAGDPTIYNSVLALKAAEAQMLQSQQA